MCIRDRCTSVCGLVAQMEKIRSRATAAFQKRLNERLRELLHGAGIEPQRLAQEAAMLAERSDISEELIRLKTHAAQLEKLLDASGEVGKRLDFLLQEMNREANTIPVSYTHLDVYKRQPPQSLRGDSSRSVAAG